LLAVNVSSLLNFNRFGKKIAKNVQGSQQWAPDYAEEEDPGRICSL
jgi:hypothetical protein